MKRGTVQIILVAAFGGILSNLVDVARGLQAATPHVPDTTYWLGCLLWAACGAGVALAWGEDNLKKVLYIGLAFPSIVQLNINTLSKPAGENYAAVRTTNPAGAMLDILVPGAYAQPAHVAVTGRQLRATLGARAPKGNGYRVVFYDAANNPTYDGFPDNGNTVSVPAGATRVAVEYRGVRSRPLPLPMTQGAGVSISVDVRSRTWSGFFRSVGVRSASRYTVIIRKIE